ncbi:hypothetical protein GOBAR_DD02509 [Gossypium barbadense]|nr:hypothetical protein GOBAR_DD02509 [Gossypium barbadense]
MALESSFLSQPTFISSTKSSPFKFFNRNLKFPSKFLSKIKHCPTPQFSNQTRLGLSNEENEQKKGILGAMVCGILILGCKRVFAVEEVVNAGYVVTGKSMLLLRNAWPKASMILKVFKEQGVVLTLLLGLSALFSMAETAITTLWPWKIHELAEKESEDGVFKILHSDVTRFLTTILIGTTTSNIGATTLVTDAATKIFGKAVMTACFIILFFDLFSCLCLACLQIFDMIENVLETKDTHVREVMTPLIDVVVIDASSTLRVDNIVGIAYGMDLLNYVAKGELLESTTVGYMAHKPAYFVHDSMSGWNFLREFCIRKVHMTVVLNKYGGIVGIVTLEDVVEEIVGEIFDENDSKVGLGVFDVDANTSIYQLSEDLNIKFPEEHQYEKVSGFVCEAFGYIPRTGESIKVVLEKEDEEDDEDSEAGSDHHDSKERHQIYKLEILAGNARKVSAVRFECINNEEFLLDTMEVTPKVPKIMKSKRSNDEDSNNGNNGEEDAFGKRQEDDLSDHYITADHNENKESPYGQ